MEKLNLFSFGLLVLFITFSSFGQICMKIGLAGDQIPISKSPFSTFINIIKFMLRPWVFVGLVLYVFSAFSWLLFLSRVPLSVAYPMISIGYVFVMLLSVLILHEKVKWKYAAFGLLFIAAGVSFIGLGMGRMGGK